MAASAASGGTVGGSMRRVSRAFLRRSHDQRAKQQQKQPDHRRDSKRLPHSQALPCPTRIFYDTYAYYIRRRTARQVQKRRAERFPAVLAAFSKMLRYNT